MSNFQLVALAHEPFEPLFDLPDDQLAEIGALRVRADENPGYPCRVSLEDARVGEELLLLPFSHLPEISPYRSVGPIYVRRGARSRTLAPGEIPDYVASRLISIRAYDASHLMVGAAVREGSEVAAEIESQFRRERVAYLHLHNAKPGCFSCAVRRVEAKSYAPPHEEGRA
jgi:hypothetical protein